MHKFISSIFFTKWTEWHVGCNKVDFTCQENNLSNTCRTKLSPCVSVFLAAGAFRNEHSLRAILIVKQAEEGTHHHSSEKNGRLKNPPNKLHGWGRFLHFERVLLEVRIFVGVTVGREKSYSREMEVLRSREGSPTVERGKLYGREREVLRLFSNGGHVRGLKRLIKFLMKGYALYSAYWLMASAFVCYRGKRIVNKIHINSLGRLIKIVSKLKKINADSYIEPPELKNNGQLRDKWVVLMLEYGHCNSSIRAGNSPLPVRDHHAGGQN